MTGDKCTSLHFGKGVVVLDPSFRKASIIVDPKTEEVTSNYTNCSHDGENSSDCSALPDSKSDSVDEKDMQALTNKLNESPEIFFVNTLSNDIEKIYLFFSFILVCCAAYLVGRSKSTVKTAMRITILI